MKVWLLERYARTWHGLPVKGLATHKAQRHPMHGYHREQLRRKRLASKPLQISNMHIGGGQGENHYLMHAHHGDPNRPAGTLRYSTYRGDTHVSMLQVEKPHQRKGIGTAMMRELHRLHKNPDLHADKPRKVRYGYSTPSGSKLLAALPFGKRRKQ